MRYLPLLLAATLLVGCESDEAKLKRLQDAKLLADLNIIYRREQVRDSAAKKEIYADSLRIAERQLLLAERALRKFLDGR